MWKSVEFANWDRRLLSVSFCPTAEYFWKQNSRWFGGKICFNCTCQIIFQPSVSRPGMGLHVARARPRPTRSFGPHDADGPPQRNSYIYEYITINIHSKEVSEAYCEAVNGDFPNASHEQNTFPRGNYVPRAYKRREIIGSPQFNILHVYWLHYQQLIKLKEMFLKNFLFSFSLWRSWPQITKPRWSREAKVGLHKYSKSELGTCPKPSESVSGRLAETSHEA